MRAFRETEIMRSRSPRCKNAHGDCSWCLRPVVLGICEASDRESLKGFLGGRALPPKNLHAPLGAIARGDGHDEDGTHHGGDPVPELRHRIRISAPLSPVWSALTTAQGLQAWWAPDVEVDEAGGYVSVKAGSANFVWSAKNNGESGIVEWTCLEGPGSSPGSVVTFAVAADDDDHTVVTLVHEGWTEEDPNIEACNTRWGGLLHALKNASEQSRPAPVYR